MNRGGKGGDIIDGTASPLYVQSNNQLIITFDDLRILFKDLLDEAGKTAVVGEIVNDDGGKDNFIFNILHTMSDDHLIVAPEDVATYNDDHKANPTLILKFYDNYVDKNVVGQVRVIFELQK